MISMRYETLDVRVREIRLLLLLPLSLDNLAISSENLAQHEHQLLRCDIETVSLDSSPTYQALSYQWRPNNASKDPEKILVAGNVVEITSNLELALRHIRQAQQSVRIWVDALCINQEDEKEKSEQVRMMKSIYEDAASVVVWLGPAYDDSDLAIDTLEALGVVAQRAGILQLRRTDYAIWAGTSPGPSDHLISIRNALDECSDNVGLDLPCKALQSFSERGYWTRVWIVQEFVLPRAIEIFCGSKIISFDLFAAGMRFFSYHRVKVQRIMSENPQKFRQLPGSSAFLAALINSATSGLVALRRKHHFGESGLTSNLVTLLTAGCIALSDFSSCRQTSQPVDKIFGILALADDHKILGIDADYTKTVQQVYTTVTRTLIEHGHLVLLSWCQPPKTVQGLPSWVPDFSAPLRGPCCDRTDQAIFSASRQRSVFICPSGSDGPNILALRGTIVDTVLETGSLWAPGMDVDYTAEPIVNLFNEILQYCTRSWTLDKSRWSDNKTFSDAIWKIPCAEQEIVGSRRTRVSSDGLQGYFELANSAAFMSATGGFLRPSAACQRYIIAMSYLHNRRPLISVTGYVGLVPAHSKPGDIVAILYGATVPFVLRRQENGYYELIGEAYVFGIMDGEFLESDPPSEDFSLC